jgi:uncharacterized membrane protein
MSESILDSKLPILRAPLYAMMLPFGAACFIGTFITDIVYAYTAQMMWADFSAWFVTIGVILGFITLIIGLVEFLTARLMWERARPWPYVLSNILALALATVNMFVHTRDAWTSVIPWGLTLSTLVIFILALTAWMSWSIDYRYRRGVAP